MKGNPYRNLQAREIQHLTGGYYIRQTGKPEFSEVLTPDQIKRIGGNLNTIEDQCICANGDTIQYGLTAETERRQWGQLRQLKNGYRPNVYEKSGPNG